MIAPRRGAAAIEFALLLPVLAVMVTGVADAGWYMHETQLAAQAVREGARVGAGVRLDGTPSPASVATTRTLQVLEMTSVDPSVVTVDATYSNRLSSGSCDTDDTLTVRATFPFQPLVGLIPLRPTVSTSMSVLLIFSDCRS